MDQEDGGDVMSASALGGHSTVGPLGGESEPGWAAGRTGGRRTEAMFVQSKLCVKVKLRISPDCSFVFFKAIYLIYSFI